MPQVAGIAGAGEATAGVVPQMEPGLFPHVAGATGIGEPAPMPWSAPAAAAPGAQLAGGGGTGEPGDIAHAPG